MTPYEQIGGDDAVRAIVERFYDLMDSRPDCAELRALHAADLAHARKKLYMFLSGWLGGPPLYIEQYGHPRLRARHLPFAIDADGRDQWMRCMEQALNEAPMDPAFRGETIQALERLATHMINRD